METFFAEGTLTQEQLRRGPANAPPMAGKIFPLVCTSGLHAHRHPAAARRDRQLRAVARRTRVPGARRRRRRDDASRPPTRRRTRRSSGRRSPTRSPAASRCCASSSGTLKSDATVHNVTRDAPERLGHLLAAAGQDADARAGAEGGRPRRRRQAERHAHQRRARRQEHERSSSPPIKFPEPVLAYAIEPKSRGDEDKISTSMQRLRGGRPDASTTRATRRPTSCCWPARASCTSR